MHLASEAFGSRDLPQFAITNVVAHAERVPPSRRTGKPLGIAYQPDCQRNHGDDRHNDEEAAYSDSGWLYVR